jgi:YD repeat-containing protein
MQMPAWRNVVASLFFLGLFALIPNSAYAVTEHIRLAPTPPSSQQDAQQACRDFAEYYGYTLSGCVLYTNLQTGKHFYSGGWFRSNGPNGSDWVDFNFYLREFYFCYDNEIYDEMQNRCVVTAPYANVASPLQNGPTCDVNCGQPIFPGTGNMWHLESDYVSPVRNGLNFVRYYNSSPHIPPHGDRRLPALGWHWTHPYQSKLVRIYDTDISWGVRTGTCRQRMDTKEVICFPVGNVQRPARLTAVSIYRPDGKMMMFLENSGRFDPQNYHGNDSLRAERASDGTITRFIYTAPDNSVEEYDFNGLLLLKRAQDGTTQRLTYATVASNDSSIHRYPADAPICAPIPATEVPHIGALLCVTDHWGRQLRFEHKYGNIHKVYNPGGGVTEYSYGGPSAGCQMVDGKWNFLCQFGNLTKVTYPDGGARVYHYNESWLINSGKDCPGAVSLVPGFGHMYRSLTGITDENGNRHMNWSYDCQGRATMSELAGGVEKVTMEYSDPDESGARQTLVTHTMGTTAAPVTTQRTFSYGEVSGQTRQSKISAPCVECGPHAERTYDSSGEFATTTDWAGNKTVYTRERIRSLEIKRVEAYGTEQARTISTEWHPSLRLPTAIAEPKRITRYTYDASGNRLTMSVQPTTDQNGTQAFSAAPSGPMRKWTYTYNAVGQLLTEDGPRTDITDITTYAYDAMGNLESVTNALAQTTGFGNYDAEGRPGRIAQPNGVNVDLSYNPRGLLASRTVYSGGESETTTYHYDPAGQLKSVVQPDGSSITMNYDAAHRLIGIADSNGNTIKYELDLTGNRIGERISDASGNLQRNVTRVFDTMNRVKQVTGGAQ